MRGVLSVRAQSNFAKLNVRYGMLFKNFSRTPTDPFMSRLVFLLPLPSAAIIPCNRPWKDRPKAGSMNDRLRVLASDLSSSV